MKENLTMPISLWYRWERPISSRVTNWAFIGHMLFLDHQCTNQYIRSRRQWLWENWSLHHSQLTFRNRAGTGNIHDLDTSQSIYHFHAIYDSSFRFVSISAWSSSRSEVRDDIYQILVSQVHFLDPITCFHSCRSSPLRIFCIFSQIISQNSYISFY